MDNTFFNVHPNERIFYRSNRQNHFLKAIFKKQVKKITEKTAKTSKIISSRIRIETRNN